MVHSVIAQKSYAASPAQVVPFDVVNPQRRAGANEGDIHLRVTLPLPAPEYAVAFWVARQCGEQLNRAFE